MKFIFVWVEIHNGKNKRQQGAQNGVICFFCKMLFYFSTNFDEYYFYVPYTILLTCEQIVYGSYCF